jgi:hypothetical protein
MACAEEGPMPLILQRFAHVFVVPLLFIGVVCAAQSQFPDTPAGHQSVAWLVAFNTGNRETYRDLLQKNFPSRAEGLDQEMNFREMTGALNSEK